MIVRVPGSILSVTIFLLIWPGSLARAQEPDPGTVPSGASASETGPPVKAEPAEAGQLQNRLPPDLPRTSPAPTPATVQSQYVHLTGKEKWQYYLSSTYGLEAVARSVASSAVNQARDTNPEWGQGMEGYTKRLGSKFGRHAIKRSVAQGLGAWWKEDPRYVPATSTGIMPRTLHAVSYVFITRKDDGSYKIADARMIGTFAGGMASRLWQPPDDRNFRSGLETTAVSLAIDAGWNIFKEFWPDIRRKLRR